MNYTENNKKAISWLKGNLDEERLLHSLGCAQEAASLADKFGLDSKKAYIAGLLHDCAKCLSKEKLQEIAQLIPLEDGEFENMKILHAPVSAYLAKEEFGIEDEEILSAIRWHTLGKQDMTTFEKIVFLADKIEPNTRDLDYRDRIMMLLQDDNGINRAMLVCYKETIKSLLARNLKICKSTIDLYNSMLG
jgi:predicted HD superfamily hydrolase involved in NAD metabolism